MDEEEGLRNEEHLVEEDADAYSFVAPAACSSASIPMIADDETVRNREKRWDCRNETVSRETHLKAHHTTL